MAKRKITKPATEAQKRASQRNWNKGHTLCMKDKAITIRNDETTKLSERLILADIIFKLDKILANWTK